MGQDYFRLSEKKRLIDLKSELCDVRLEYGPRLVELYKKRSGVQKRYDQEEIKKQLATFPKTVEEFSAIPYKDVKLAFARFLQMDKAWRNASASTNGWKWEQTKPLIDVYETNVSKKIGEEALKSELKLI